jgi:hypothetical protein
MKLKTFLLAAGVSVAMASPAFADSFGVRLGYPLGVQYSTGGAFTKENLRIAVNLNPFLGLGIGAQGDWYFLQDDIATVKGLNYKVGAGPQASFYSFGSLLYSYTYFSVGAHVSGGLEYKLSDTLSAFVDTAAGLDFRFGDFGTYASFIGPFYGGSIGLNFKL